jgi:AmmeMemoRadiSam system protein A
MAPSSSPPQDSAHNADQDLLLRIARESIRAAAARRPAPALDLPSLSEWLQSVRASFVTLTRAGALRGCIGALQASLPLALDVQEHAAAAATEDYRFPPVSPEEAEALEIEISVLTIPQPLEFASPEELLARLRPQIDGVIITSGLHRATFLPQVWEHVPDPAQFMGMLCEKARLPEQAWRHGRLEVQTYQVESFHEHRG